MIPLGHNMLWNVLHIKQLELHISVQKWASYDIWAYKLYNVLLTNWHFTLSVVKLTVSDCLPVKDAIHYLINYVDCSGLFISFWFEIIFLFSCQTIIISTFQSKALILLIILWRRIGVNHFLLDYMTCYLYFGSKISLRHCNLFYILYTCIYIVLVYLSFYFTQLHQCKSVLNCLNSVLNKVSLTILKAPLT